MHMYVYIYIYVTHIRLLDHRVVVLRRMREDGTDLHPHRLLRDHGLIIRMIILIIIVLIIIVIILVLILILILIILLIIIIIHGLLELLGVLEAPVALEDVALHHEGELPPEEELLLDRGAGALRVVPVPRM